MNIKTVILNLIQDLYNKCLWIPIFIGMTLIVSFFTIFPSPVFALACGTCECYPSTDPAIPDCPTTTVCGQVVYDHYWGYCLPTGQYYGSDSTQNPCCVGTISCDAEDCSQCGVGCPTPTPPPPPTPTPGGPTPTIGPTPIPTPGATVAPTGPPFNVGPDPAGLAQIEQLFINIISIVVALGFVALFVLLTWAGFKYLTSGGDPKAIQAAHQTVTWAFLGVIFLAVAWLILRLIEAFTGINVTVFNIGILL